MSIGNSLDLDRMLKEVTATLLSRLNCSAVAVYQTQPRHDRPIFARPKVLIRNRPYQTALKQLSGRFRRERQQVLTLHDGTTHYYLYELKNFGYLVLAKNGTPLESILFNSLTKISLKLVNAIQACLDSGSIRTYLRRLDQTQKLAHVGSWELELSGSELFCSHEVYQILRVTPGKSPPALEEFLRFVPEPHRDRIEQTLEQTLLGGDIRDISFPVVLGDGSHRDLQILCEAERDIDGTPKRLRGALMDVTEHFRSNELKDLLEHALNEMYIIDARTLRYLYASKGALQNIGYTLDELLQMDVFDINPGLTREQAAGFQQQLETHDTIESYSRHRRKDGTFYPVQALVQKALYQGRDVNVIFDTDITGRIEAERQLEAERAFLQTVIDSISDTLMVIRADYSVELMNRSAASLFDPAVVADPEHPKCHELLHGRSTPCDLDSHGTCPLHDVLREGRPMSAVHRHRQREGGLSYSELVASPLPGGEGRPYAIIEAARDITSHLAIQEKLREQKEMLHYQAHHDTLTGLPNRLLLQDRLHQAIKKAKRERTTLALLFIDLDRFKEINDSLGHEIGDRMLKLMAQKFRKALRDSDTIARLGGDEFTVLLESLPQPGRAAEVGQKLMQALQTPVRIDGHTLYVTASIGISVYPGDGETPQELLRNADSAMYRAKEEGRNTYCYYTADMTDEAFERVVMETQLRDALAQKGFLLYYQPQVSCGTGEVTGMEALIRWKHPDMGLVPPASFLPMLEEAGMMLQLDAWVLESACRQAAAWHRSGHRFGRIAVNLSGQQLRHASLFDTVNGTLMRTGCRPEWLELEVTEGFIMHDPQRSIEVLQRIRDLGVTLAIDDFGTGYSSLAYLKRLPLHTLKIDKSFVRDLPADEEDKAITRTIIALAKVLRLGVLAEGVETSAQHDFLYREGCDCVQGYHIARPMPAEESAEWLRRLSASAGASPSPLV